MHFHEFTSVAFSHFAIHSSHIFLVFCFFKLFSVEVLYARNLKGGIGSLFDPCVNTTGQRPYCPSRMEVSYCTFGFGAIIQCDLRTLSLPCDSLRKYQYVCVIFY